MKLVAGEQTDVGRVRDGNEDEKLVDDRIGLFAVADGMGGHVGGEVASSTALEALRAAVAAGAPIRDAIARANDAVIERAAADERLRGMGTTMTAATLAAGGTLLIGHVGDSRAYLARDDDLTQITEDHSLVEEMVRGGELTPEQAEVHPRRSVITRALGMDAGVDVDLYPVELHTGDRVLLCSDGLTSMIRPDEIASILRRERDPQAAANKLVDAANAAGGEDNITVVILDAAEGDAVPAVAEREVIGDAEAPAPRKERQRRLAGTTRVVKVLLWVLPVILVIALAFGAVGWYARRTYYVTIDDRRVTVFKGVPGGLLGWDPTLEERTSLRASDLTEAERSDLEDEKRFSSRDKADEFVDRLQRKVDDREEAATTSTTTVTTTVPPPSAPSP
jgi:protein phosphatase